MKNKKVAPTVKLQALKLLKSLMESKNPHILEYCSKKFYNRFKIFAEFKKDSKDDHRGKSLFQAETLYEQLASEEFLSLLHFCIKLWARLHPFDTNGKVSGYKKLFDYLNTRGVPFLEMKFDKEKEELKKKLKGIKKSMKLLTTGIIEKKDIEKVKRIGKNIKVYQAVLISQIDKYMDMEDHEVIKQLNETLEMLNNSKNIYKLWKSENKRISILDQPSFVLPPSCLFLPDICPKVLPEGDSLSKSIQEMSLEDSFYETFLNEKDLENERDLVSVEWKGLGADYCRLKDQLGITERNMNSYQHDLQVLTELYDDEKQKSERLERENEILIENLELKEEDVFVLSENLSKTASELRDSREYSRNLEASIKNLEIRLKNLKKDLETKQSVFEKFEVSNKTLESVCKSLENQLESSRQSEKMLKKELKELKELKDLKDLKTQENCLFSQCEDRPAKSIRFSLIEAIEPLASVEEIESPFSEGEDFKLMTAGGFISARKPLPETPSISNLKNLKILMKKRQGLLYENPSIQVSFFVKTLKNQGICKVLIKNKTTHILKNLKTKLFSDPSNGLTIRINSEIQEFLESNSEILKVLKFEVNSVFKGFPLLKLCYSLQSQKQEALLSLPVSYTLFCTKEKIDFVEEWEAIDETRDFSSITSFNSIKKLARRILLSRNFEYAYIEGNGVIIGSKSSEGVVLAICLLQNSTVSVSVKSKNTKLRDLVHSLLKLLLEP
jgi:hypothetical protein